MFYCSYLSETCTPLIIVKTQGYIFTGYSKQMTLIDTCHIKSNINNKDK